MGSGASPGKNTRHQITALGRLPSIQQTELMNRKERIDRVQESLKPYAENVNSTELDISDLLADLMHFCEEDGDYSFDTCLERASRHYEAEIEAS